MELIRQVDHPHFKLHMDVKAQSSEPGTTVPELIRRYAPQAGHFHAQDVNLRGPGMGDVDFGPIMKALVESGYDRWVSVEVFDFSPVREETARQSIACLEMRLLGPDSPSTRWIATARRRSDRLIDADGIRTTGRRRPALLARMGCSKIDEDSGGDETTTARPVRSVEQSTDRRVRADPDVVGVRFSLSPFEIFFPSALP